METCADCGKPILMFEGSYYKRDPAGDFGKTYHSFCGDPFGGKAKDAEIARLRAENERLRRDCAELYQVIGVMAEFCPEDPAIIKALDNASDGAAGCPRRHDDLLPFTLPVALEQKARQGD